MGNENREVDGAEVHALIVALGILSAGQLVNAEKIVKAVGKSPELAEIIRTADEGIELVEQLLDMLFDFDMET
jgi:hypothetical protein